AVRVLVVCLLVEDTVSAAHHDVFGSCGPEQLGDGVTGRTSTGEHHTNVLQVLLDHFERVLQCGQCDDRSAMLIIVEHGDVQLLPQAGFDLKAPGRGDVL